MLGPAVGRSFAMLDPRAMARNPVMFVTELGAALTTLVTIVAIATGGEGTGYFAAVTVLLWLTVLFANFAEAVAEARGRTQAASLRSARKDVMAQKVAADARQVLESVPASQLVAGDLVVVKAGETIPADGEVVEGVASVDESAITGESTRSSVRAAGIGVPSQAAPVSSPIISSSRSRRSRERAFSIA